MLWRTDIGAPELRAQVFISTAKLPPVQSPSASPPRLDPYTVHFSSFDPARFWLQILVSYNPRTCFPSLTFKRPNAVSRVGFITRRVRILGRCLRLSGPIFSVNWIICRGLEVSR